MTAAVSTRGRRPADGLTGWPMIRPPLVTAAVIGAATVVLRMHDPHQQGSYGYCPWLLLTGLYCPVCGSLRATNDLARGHLVAAASSNLLFVAMVPVLAMLWLRWLVRRWRGEDVAMVALGSRGTAALISVMVVFAVVRNLSWGAWLAP